MDESIRGIDHGGANGTRVRGRWRSPLSSFVPLVLALMVALAGSAACSRDGAGSRDRSIVGTAGAGGSVHSVGDVLKSGATGERVTVSGRVTRIEGPRTFWIGGGGAEALVVAPEGGLASAGLRPGKDVTVQGEVRKPRPEESISGLGRDDETALRRADVYINADQIEPGR